eukprot:CAMPEP_0195509270 /NCGR_PEP_ID=MMETSP0794_2-20130614/2246_1 /TAXON_ID=515487 /ORGANISM="Stephanopyxis turris, Strain CCMP 815" /LENGTH=569 /DNA_ID=CAMNT_0040636439 /DNA_START=239 /DNA_END=1948 /DNA_ORIENTATION=-
MEEQNNNTTRPLASSFVGDGEEELSTNAPSSSRCCSFILRSLGFTCSNPFSSFDVVIAMISNFGTSYNVVNIGFVLQILHEYDGTEDSSEKDRQDAWCASSILAGMMVGQLLGGALGDCLGRHRAMVFTILLQIIASIGSASSSTASADFTVYDILAVWRFVLGIGCGGVYPLAATLTAESTPNEFERGKLVALTFSTQGPGFLSVPLFTWLITSQISDTPDKMNIAWRFILGLGCVPGVIVVAIIILVNKCNVKNMCGLHNNSSSMETSVADVGSLGYALLEGEIGPLEISHPSNSTSNVHNIQQQDDGEHQSSNSSLVCSILSEPYLARKMCGTALTWFLFDVLFYGNTLFTPVVLDKAFGPAETIGNAAADATILSLIALPGYYVSVLVIGKDDSKCCHPTTPRYVQLQGFAMMGIFYGIIGIWFVQIQHIKWLLLLMYGLTFFFANYGPNTTTFTLPSITFSASCRSTLNGISAACGKLGALLGATLFEPVANSWGDANVMLICAGISVVAWVFTWFCVVSSDVDAANTNEEEERRDTNLEEVYFLAEGEEEMNNGGGHAQMIQV